MKGTVIYRGKATQFIYDEDFHYLKYQKQIKFLANTFSINLRGYSSDDLEQIAYIHLWDKSKDYDPTQSKEITWVVRVVKNLYINIVRQNRRHTDDLYLDEGTEDLVFVDDQFTPEDEIIWDNLVKKIRDRLEDEFVQLVFDCKVAPETVYVQGKFVNKNLCERARMEYRARLLKKRKGEINTARGVEINLSTISRHLTAMLGMKITTGEVRVAMQNIKQTTLSVLAST